MNRPESRGPIDLWYAMTEDRIILRPDAKGSLVQHWIEPRREEVYRAD